MLDELVSTGCQCPKKWMPIETAPKSEWILVATNPRSSVRIDMVRWVDCDVYPEHKWIDLDGDRHPNNSISHWMPLPSLPDVKGMEIVDA
jgi:hypothetical protein